MFVTILRNPNPAFVNKRDLVQRGFVNYDLSRPGVRYVGSAKVRMMISLSNLPFSGCEAYGYGPTTFVSQRLILVIAFADPGYAQRLASWKTFSPMACMHFCADKSVQSFALQRLVFFTDLWRQARNLGRLVFGREKSDTMSIAFFEEKFVILQQLNFDGQGPSALRFQNMGRSIYRINSNRNNPNSSAMK